MIRLSVILVVLFALVIVGCSWLPFGDGPPERMIVRFEDLTPELQEIADRGIEVLRRLDFIDAIVCELTPRQQDWMEKVFDVKYIELIK